VAAVQAGRVRLGICAPACVRVDRQEVYERRSYPPCLLSPHVEEGCSGEAQHKSIP
jgi:hypothetical protein